MNLRATIAGLIFTTLAFATTVSAEPNIEGRPQVTLKGSVAQIGVDIGGGSIVDFHLLDQGLNPLSWNYAEKGDTAPRTMGHFLCFDRWGGPTRAEQKNGMPFHGEAAKVIWEVLAQPEAQDGSINAVMKCTLPIGGLSLTRTLSLYEDSPVLLVREEITNLNKLGRVYNIIQHATIAPPFLDEGTLIDANVSKGYAQGNPMPTPEEPAFYWPQIAYRGRLVDLRRLAGSASPGVVSFVSGEGGEHGWVTAANPAKGLLIGWIWKTAEYPWLNLWRNTTRDGKPAARGMEFGTTGLHRPYPETLAKGSINGKPIFEFIDAGQTIEKSYVAFLTKIPADFQGVKTLQYTGKSITLTLTGEDAAQLITIPIK